MDVSVIILTTGSEERLGSLDKILGSIRRQSLVPCELIVASEVSSDQLKELLQKYFCLCENHKIIATGYWNKCRTANRAINESKGDIIFLLEDDLILKDGLVEELLKTFDLESGIGCVYSRCIWVYPEGLRSKIGLMGSVARAVNKLSVHESVLPKHVKRVSSYMYEVPVFTMSVACRREALYRAGLYDEGVSEPISGEDYDLALRVRKAGYKIMLNTNAVSYHFTRQVTKRSLKLSDNRKYLGGVNESEVYLITKNRDVLGFYVVLHAVYRVIESIAWGIRAGSMEVLLYSLTGTARGFAKGLRSS